MIIAMMNVSAGSKRSPFKAVRLINNEPLFIHSLNRVTSSVDVSRIIITTSTEPIDDLLTYNLMQMDFDVYRHSFQSPTSGDLLRQKAADYFGLKDDDIIVSPSADAPFAYRTDLHYRVELLKNSDKEIIWSAPTDQFPIFDWEWAVTSPGVFKVSVLRNVLKHLPYSGLIKYGTEEALEAWRSVLRSGFFRPLFVQKTKEAAKSWDYQPLWVDEPGQFEKAKIILTEIGNNPPDSMIRTFLETRDDVLMLAQNAPRRTVNAMCEDWECVKALRKLAELEGVMSAYDE